MCKTEYNAQQVAYWAAQPNKYYHDKQHNDNEGYYPHFHPNRSSHVHIWYYN